jgi:hypothetical protein
MSGYVPPTQVTEKNVSHIGISYSRASTSCMPSSVLGGKNSQLKVLSQFD